MQGDGSLLFVLGQELFHCYLLHGALFDDTTFKLQEDELTMNMFLHVCKFRCLSELDDVTLSLSPFLH